MKLKQPAHGFTLIELTITMGIIAILSTVVVYYANPSEALKKSRDTQRLSDLAALTDALNAYLSQVPDPDLDAGVQFGCLNQSNSDAVISYSAPYSGGYPQCSGNVSEGAEVTTSGSFGPGAEFVTFCRYVTSANMKKLDGTGWIPVNLTAIPGGSPIKALPVDPSNSMQDKTTPTSTDLVYRYACQGSSVDRTPNNNTSLKKDLIFELDAQLESYEYTVTDDKRKSTNDGGDNDNYYETGTSTKLIGTGTNF